MIRSLRTVDKRLAAPSKTALERRVPILVIVIAAAGCPPAACPPSAPSAGPRCPDGGSCGGAASAFLPQWGGCFEVRRAPVSGRPVCHVKPDDKLTFFIPRTAPEAELSVRQGNEQLTVGQRVAVLDGVRLTVGGFRPDHPVKLVRREPYGAFELRLQPARVPPALDFNVVRSNLKTERHITAAEAALKPYLDSDDPVERAKAWSVRARLRYRMRPPQTATVAAMLERSVRLQRAANLVSDEYLDRFMGLYQQRTSQAGGTDAAEAWLRPLDALKDLYPVGEARRLYYLTVALLDTGSVHRAIERATEAMRRLQELDHPEAMDARFNLVELFMSVGRYEDAARLVEQIDPTEFAEQRDYNTMIRLMNYGLYGSLLARMKYAKKLDVESTLRWADVAIELLEERYSASFLGGELHKAHAAAWLYSGDAAKGLKALDKTEPYLSSRPTLRLVVERLTAFAHELQGRFEMARKEYTRVERSARQLNVPEELRESLHGQARTLVRLGHLEQALDVLGRAESVLDIQIAALPLGLGRESFLANHEQIGALHVALLLEQGRRDDAYQAVVRAHRRSLAAIARAARVDRLSAEQRQHWLDARKAYQQARGELMAWWASQPPKWKLSSSRRRQYEIVDTRHRRVVLQQLQRALTALGDDGDVIHRPGPRPPEGEALLAVHPLPESKWVGFLQTSTGAVQVATVTSNGGPTIEPSALTALIAQLDIPATVGHLALLDSATLRKVNLATIPYQGAAIAARWTTGLALDIERRAERATQRVAVVIQSDPFDDLSYEDDEARVVIRTLEAAGFRVTSIGGPSEPEATVERVTAALTDPAVSLVHFVGHGRHAGIDGWQSGLLMHGGLRLTAADILLLETVPPFVILSACSTGKAGRGRVATGLGLAQAFMIRGARWVLGTTEVVDDKTSFELIQRLYATGFASKLAEDPDEWARPPIGTQTRFRVWEIAGAR